MDAGILNMKLKNKIAFLILIFIIGGLGGILANRYVFPYLASTKPFCNYDFFKKLSDQVTVINRTEQVYMKEEFSLDKVTSQASSSVVSVIISPILENNYLKRKIDLEGPISKSGVVATSDGVIITYLDPAVFSYFENLKYQIITKEGNNFEAEFLGFDSYSNLAFLKINANNLTAISFANSDEARPGEKIVAIGANSGKFRTQYASGLLENINESYNLAGKTISSSEKLEGVFKADFNLEESYAGGSVVDYSGQAIGVIGSVKRNNTDDFFVIPSNKVKEVLNKAIRKELSTNPILGIYYIPLSKDYAFLNNFSQDKGAFIYSPSGQQGLAIIAGTPADKADLRINDIITHINGEEINLENSLPELLYKHKKGENIEIDLTREEKNVKVKVQL